MSKPEGEVLAALDRQIEEEKRIPADVKIGQRERLRRLMHLGNLLRGEDGVSEAWLVNKLPQEFVLLTSWGSVTSRRNVLKAQWAKAAVAAAAGQ